MTGHERTQASNEKFALIKTLRETQPDLYQAICDYGMAMRTNDAEKGFDAGARLAQQILDLASGLHVNATVPTS